MLTESNEIVERELLIAARPETIWPFLTEADKLVQWMGKSAELDPKPGGIYYVNMNNKNIARGEFLQLEPYSRVVFSWGWEDEGAAVPPGASTIEITLTPEGDKTMLRLRHTGLPQSEVVGHGEGWDWFAPNLIRVAEEAEVAAAA